MASTIADSIRKSCHSELTRKHVAHALKEQSDHTCAHAVQVAVYNYMKLQMIKSKAALTNGKDQENPKASSSGVSDPEQPLLNKSGSPYGKNRYSAAMGR